MALASAAAGLVGRMPADADAGLEILLLDAGGKVTARAGASFAEVGAGGAWSVPDGDTHGSFRQELPDGSALVALSRPGCDAQLLVASLAQAAEEIARLDEDLDSMSSSSVSLLEQVAMIDELVTSLPNCTTDDEVVQLGLQKLLVAAGVRGVAYVEWSRRAGRCTIRHAFDADRDGKPVARPLVERPFDPATSLVDMVLSGGRDHLLVEVPAGVRLGAAGLPEASARSDFLAVPVALGDSSDDRNVGVIVLTDKCVDRYSHGDRLGSQEQRLAATLARLVGAAIGSRRAAAISKELGLAREIQQQILPIRPPTVAGFDFAGRCETSGAVGGDYYDFVPMADGRTLAVVADVSGHNLASGMVMVGAHTALRLLAHRSAKPADVITGVAETLSADLARTEQFISVAGVAIRPGEPVVEIVNAGHADLLVRRAASGTVQRYESIDAVLGFMDGVRYASLELELRPGDVMLLYTDGVTEAQNAHGEMLGDDRLEAVLRSSRATSAAAILAEVFAAVASFADPSRGTDDVTVLVVRRRSVAEGLPA